VEDESLRSVADVEGGASDAIRLRTHNLGVDGWGIWPGPDGASLADELEDPDGPRCLVVDLGSLDRREEQAITAGHVLERLWRRRGARQPGAVGVDEGPNAGP